MGSNTQNFTASGFYGSKNKRKCLGIERAIEDTVRKHKREKLPKAFPCRILGPTVKWDTFYRQQDAFTCARSTSKDLHVFAFESETFTEDSGQRMYLVASYPVFWHYYSQLESDRKHHYEVIPEGAVCKLYFDLEFPIEQNSGRDGDRMVETLVKYTSLCLQSEFSLRCSFEQVLDLEASTPSKFSRHLIFQLRNAAFKDNIHAGRFVCHMFSQLLKKIKSEKDTCHSSVTKTCGNSQSCGSEIQTSQSNHLQEVVTDQLHVSKAEKSSESMSSANDLDSETARKYRKILDNFTEENLRSLLVKNKNGDEVLFCDTGVYTKNRNFRLYQSTKLSKKNPLVVSDKNQYKPDKQKDEQIFYDSLVSNVAYSDGIRILTFEKNDSLSCSQLLTTPRTGNKKSKETMEGYSQSPYPEIDHFIHSLVTDGGANGVIRHWMYFQQGELLLYEIGRYRYCHNIGRQHKSNNIMFLVDLRKGVYYQKCHDPDCQIQNFRSAEWLLPPETLPAHYFSIDEADDMDQELEDQECIMAAEEMEKQYLQNLSAEKQKGTKDDLSFEDGEDEALFSAAEDLESSILNGS